MHFHVHIRTNSDVEIGEDVTSAVPARQRRLDKVGKRLRAHEVTFVPWNKNLSHWTLWAVRPKQKHIDYYEPRTDVVDVADMAGKTSLLAYVNEIAQSMVS
jgi:hypothetical protein